MSAGQILFIFILIGLNAFFVGVEFAVVASRRSRLDLITTPGNRAGQLVRKWLEDDSARDRLIAASQLGITLVSLALGDVGEDAFSTLLEPYFEHLNLPAGLEFFSSIIPALPLVISLTVITSLHVVLGEQVPKVAVLRSPEKFAVLTAPIMNIFSIIFKGFINVLDWTTHKVLLLLGLEANVHAHTSMMSVAELKQIVSGPETEGVIERPEREMLSAVIDFGALVVRQVMVPRTEIIAVEATTPLCETLQIAAKHGITKLPIYEDSLDQVVGVLHVKDMLPLLAENTLNQQTAKNLAREPLFVPETVSVNNLLVHMRARRQHMAITLDEFGGTAGLVTLEDLLEEIIGDVRDPFDLDAPPFQMMPDGTAIIDGMAMIEAVNQQFTLNLYDPNYDTIAGYILGRLGRLAQVGDLVEEAEQGVSLRVDSMDRLRIARILLKRL
jgi:putative hemolysin